MLNLLRGCTHFVPVVTEELRRYLAHRRNGPKSALESGMGAGAQALAPRAGAAVAEPVARATACRVPWPPAHSSRSATVGTRPSTPCSPNAATRSWRSTVGQALHRSPAVARLQLRAAHRKAGARRSSRAFSREIHDVTARA